MVERTPPPAWLHHLMVLSAGLFVLGPIVLGLVYAQTALLVVVATILGLTVTYAMGALVMAIRTEFQQRKDAQLPGMLVVSNPNFSFDEPPDQEERCPQCGVGKLERQPGSTTWFLVDLTCDHCYAKYVSDGPGDLVRVFGGNS